MKQYATHIRGEMEGFALAVALRDKLYAPVRKDGRAPVGDDASALVASVADQANVPNGYFPLSRKATGTSMPSGSGKGGNRQPSISRP
jgi:hypothetical protein